MMSPQDVGDDDGDKLEEGGVDDCTDGEADGMALTDGEFELSTVTTTVVAFVVSESVLDENATPRAIAMTAKTTNTVPNNSLVLRCFHHGRVGSS